MASHSAFSLGVLTIAAMLVGVLLISTLGGSSGRDLGLNASGEELTNAAPLLIVAEFLKGALGTCQAMLVRASDVQGKWRALASLTGYAGATLIAASGLLGLSAVFAESRGLGEWASALAFGSAGATAIWVIFFVWSTTLQLKPWHRIVGFAFAVAGLLSLVVAPVAMLAGLLGIAWWFGVSQAFVSHQPRDLGQA